jgi:hypothetical protein
MSVGLLGSTCRTNTETGAVDADRVPHSCIWRRSSIRSELTRHCEVIRAAPGGHHRASEALTVNVLTRPVEFGRYDLQVVH